MGKPNIKVVRNGDSKIIRSNLNRSVIRTRNNGISSNISHKSRYNHTHVIRTSKQNVVSDRRAFIDRLKLPRRNNVASYKHKKQITSESHDKILLLKNVGRGKILVVLAPGPSHLESPIEKLMNHDKIDVLVINKPDKRVWPSKYWMFCDRSQYNRNVDEFLNYGGTIINAVGVTARRSNQVLIKGNASTHFSRDLLKGMNIGRSTVFASMQVAYWMGYEKIFIFGCDMTRVKVTVGGQERDLLHSYGVNPDVSEEQRLERFGAEVPFYERAARELGEECKKFYFCSKYNPYDFPDLYHRMGHDESTIDFIIDQSKLL